MVLETVDTLELSTDGFVDFAMWLESEAGFDGPALIRLIEKPWKWTTEFNEYALLGWSPSAVGELVIQVGKTYADREGRPVKVTWRNDAGDFIGEHEDGVRLLYRLDGAYWLPTRSGQHPDKSPHPNDLISEL